MYILPNLLSYVPHITSLHSHLSLIALYFHSRSQIKSFEQLKEKHERDTADYNKRREIIRKLLIDHFALPEDVYDFDMDYVIGRIEPHQISMTLQQQNIFESIKISKLEEGKQSRIMFQQR